MIRPTKPLTTSTINAFTRSPKTWVAIEEGHTVRLVEGAVVLQFRRNVGIRYPLKTCKIRLHFRFNFCAEEIL
jgi:hypothetical protein